MRPPTRVIPPLCAVFLLAVSGPVCHAIAPDVYDVAFRDDAKETTLNYNEWTSGVDWAVSQEHNLDSAEDEDWIIFVPPFPDTYFYSVTVSVPRGSQIDPTILALDEDGTTRTTDPFTGQPGVWNAEARGTSESVTRSLEPGAYYIRVADAGGAWGSQADYVLEITGGPAAVLAGLGTISFTRIGPSGGKVPPEVQGIAPTLLPRSSGEEGLYPLRNVYFAGGTTPSLEQEQMVTFGRTLDAYRPNKDFDAAAAWHQPELRRRNYSIVMLQIGDELFKPGVTSFPTSATLTLQMVADPVPNAALEVDDAPDGYTAEGARVMVWNPGSSRWEVFDASPTRIQTGFFRTEIGSIANYVCTGDNHFNEVYFGLEPATAPRAPAAVCAEERGLPVVVLP